MSVFKRLLCVLLTLAILVNIPGTVPKAEAVAPGVIAGSVAIGATAVVAAMLSGLGVKPGSDSSAWDNLVSQVENHLAGLGYIADGVIKVASFKPTDDPEKLKAAIAQDIIGLVSSFLKDTGLLKKSLDSESLDSSITVFGNTYSILSKTDDAVNGFYFQVKSGSKWRAHYCAYSYGRFFVSVNGTPLTVRNDTPYLCVISSNVFSDSQYAFPIFPSADSYQVSVSLKSLLSGDVFTTDEDLDVSSVPANFTDIPTAYPSWVSSGVADAGVTYLPIGIYIPGTEAKPLPTEVPDVTDATEPSGDPDKDNDPDKILYIPEKVYKWMEDHSKAVENGYERLQDRVQQLQDGILPQIEAFKDTVTQGFIDCQNWFQNLGDTITSALGALGTKLSTGIQSIFDMLREFATQTFPAKMAELGQLISTLPQTIADAVKQTLTDLFVPSPNYWDAKIAACMAAFPLFNSIITTGRVLGGFFSGLGSRPPVIYIDLGNSASWVIGGTQKFLDLTWYAQYKPTVDTILSGFLWLLFAWRFFLRLPGLLRGEGGTIDRLGTYFDSKNTKDGK